MNNSARQSITPRQVENDMKHEILTNLKTSLTSQRELQYLVLYSALAKDAPCRASLTGPIRKSSLPTDSLTAEPSRLSRRLGPMQENLGSIFTERSALRFSNNVVFND